MVNSDRKSFAIAVGSAIVASGLGGSMDENPPETEAGVVGGARDVSSIALGVVADGITPGGNGSSSGGIGPGKLTNQSKSETRLSSGGFSISGPRKTRPVRFNSPCVGKPKTGAVDFVSSLTVDGPRSVASRTIDSMSKRIALTNNAPRDVIFLSSSSSVSGIITP